MERVLLQTIKFDLMIEHPYSCLLKFAKVLKGGNVFLCAFQYRQSGVSSFRNRKHV